MSRLISRQEAAQLLDVDRQTISNWVEHGIIKGRMVDRQLRVDRCTIEKYFDTLSDLAFSEKRIHHLKEKLKAREDELNESLEDVCKARVLLGNGLPPYLFRNVFKAVLESAGQDVLTEREVTVLMRLVVYGRTPEEIGAEYDLTRTRIMQIADFALRKIGTMQNYSDLRRDFKRVSQDNKRLKVGVGSLCRRLREQRDDQMPDVEVADASVLTLLGTPLRELNLSVRAMTCLTHAERYTMGDLVKHRKLDLLKLRNMGQRTLTELNDLVEANGLTWEMDVDSIVSAAMQQRMEKEQI